MQIYPVHYIRDGEFLYENLLRYLVLRVLPTPLFPMSFKLSQAEVYIFFADLATHLLYFKKAPNYH
jgi:hypothetical protein